jgi:uncharacterized protein (TIGR03435 family)
MALGQAFDVTSVKISQRPVGRDYQGQVIVGPAGLSGKNVTLRSLIVEAYQVQPNQVMGGPNWLDSNEYDIEAKADGSATKEQILLMLRTVLAERFRLSFHREAKELQVYELVTDKNGPNLRAAERGMSTLQLTNLISVQLTIPALSDDPSKPSIASGPAVPVLDKTGLEGTYEIKVDLTPEPGLDSFTRWQRFLRDRLGLKLESRKEKIEILVVDSAERTPTSN